MTITTLESAKITTAFRPKLLASRNAVERALLFIASLLNWDFPF
jgi:hypothetical protein